MIGRSTRFASVESDAGRAIEIYQRHAGAWSRDRGDRLIEKAWLDRFLALLSDDPTVLDIGCGTGVPIARYLIERRCQVTGVDASSAMIAMCADRFAEHEWHVAYMRTLGAKSHLRRNYCLGQLLSPIPGSSTPNVSDLQAPRRIRCCPYVHQRSVGRRPAGRLPGRASLHASLDSAEYRQLLHDNGFGVETHVVEDPDCGLHTIWLARLR